MLKELLIFNVIMGTFLFGGILYWQFRDMMVRFRERLTLNRVRELIEEFELAQAEVLPTAFLQELSDLPIDHQETMLVELQKLEPGPKPEAIAELIQASGLVKHYIHELCEALAWRTRAHAAMRLGELGDPRALPELLERARATHNEDADVRRTAIDAIGKIKDPATIPFLIRAFDEVEEWMAPRLADILVSFGKRAIKPCMEALVQSASVATRAWMIEVLGLLDASEARNLIVKQFQDNRDEIRGRAVKAIGRLRDERIHALLLDLLLNDPSPNVRINAAHAIKTSNNPIIIEGAVGALKDPAWWVRYRAVEALQHFGTAAAEALVTALEDSNPSVAGLAGVVLEQNGYLDRLILPIWDGPLGSKNERILITAARAGANSALLDQIRLLGPDRNYRPLLELLKRTQLNSGSGLMRDALRRHAQHPDFAANLLETLSAWVEVPILEEALLAELLESEEEHICLALIGFWQNHPHTFRSSVFAKMVLGSVFLASVPLRISCFNLLSSLQDPAEFLDDETLLRILKEEQEAEVLAAMLFWITSSERWSETWLEELRHQVAAGGSASIRVAALRILSRHPEEIDWRELSRVIGREVGVTRQQMIEILKKQALHNPDQWLDHLLASESGPPLIAAIETLSVLDHPLAIPVLQSFAADNDPLLAQSALRSLSRRWLDGNKPLGDFLVQHLINGKDDEQKMAIMVNWLQQDQPLPADALAVLYRAQSEPLRKAVLIHAVLYDDTHLPTWFRGADIHFYGGIMLMLAWRRMPIEQFHQYLIQLTQHHPLSFYRSQAMAFVNWVCFPKVLRNLEHRIPWLAPAFFDDAKWSAFGQLLLNSVKIENQPNHRQLMLFFINEFSHLAAIPVYAYLAKNDPDERIRIKALELQLKRLPAAERSTALEIALQDLSSKVRKIALDRLKLIEFKPALTLVLPILETADPKTFDQIVDTMAFLVERFQSLNVMVDIVLGRTNSSAGLIFLLRIFAAVHARNQESFIHSCLEDQDPVIVVQAIQTAFLLGPSEELRYLQPLLNNANAQIRASVLDQLGGYLPNGREAFVRVAEQDPNLALRIKAIIHLGSHINRTVKQHILMNLPTKSGPLAKALLQQIPTHRLAWLELWNELDTASRDILVAALPATLLRELPEFKRSEP